jgi:hypothetical protein
MMGSNGMFGGMAGGVDLAAGPSAPGIAAHQISTKLKRSGRGISIATAQLISLPVGIFASRDHQMVLLMMHAERQDAE